MGENFNKENTVAKPYLFIRIHERETCGAD